MEWKERYQEWLSADYFDVDTKEELQSIADDSAEIEDRFYKDLEFGTAGARGIVGAGTNRLNIYTVRRITQGYAQYLLAQNEDAASRGVVIAHDNRHFSDVFSLEIARTLAFNGINSYLFKDITTTPELSYAVRQLGACGGVVVTASHNPSEYNGYKVYDETGCQEVPEKAKMIVDEINRLSSYDIAVADEDDSHIHWLDDDIDCQFVEDECKVLHHPEVIRDMADQMKILYTPLHGTGKKAVLSGLERLGFKHIYTVEEQCIPDPEFPTVELPNPEDPKAFTMALDIAKQNEVDLVMATDPDCDRVGMWVRHRDGQYYSFTGNQMGALVIYYLLSTNPDLAKQVKPYIATTIVTSELGSRIASSYGVDTVLTLTGFKFIGQQMNQREKAQSFIMGYEESYGFLVSMLERDKDGVSATFTMAEMVAYYMKQGKTLVDVFHDIDERYGYYRESLISKTLPGKEGIMRMRELMDDFRHLPEEEVKSMNIKEIIDYSQETGLPKADVLKFIFEDGTWIAIRPSGTEPKIKFYIGAVATSEADAQQRLADCETWIESYLR